MKLYTKDYDNIWFTSDQHFDHRRVIEYCNRPFANVDEMNETIISNYNSVVSPRDIVFHLGDFSFGDDPETKSIYNRLKGHKHLIRGNHDKFKTTLFMTDQKFLEIVIVDTDNNKQDITLCHFSLRTWNKAHHGAFSLFGHSHGTLPPIGKQHDVGVDNNNFYPVSYEQLKTIMSTRVYTPCDHHD